MNILLVTPMIFGPGKKGGGERYVSQLCTSLIDLGNQVKILIVPNMTSVEVLAGETKQGTMLHVWKAFKWADVVHVHQLNSPGFDLAAILSKIVRVPLILTDHGGGFLCPGRAFGSQRLRLVSAAGFVSKWSREDVDPSGIVERYSVIYGGGDHFVASDSGPTALFDFGFVGRLLPHKGAHIAIQALPANSSLRIIGEPRDRDYYAYLREISAGKDIEFVSDASDSQVADLYSSIRYLLVPSVSQYRDERYTRPELLGLTTIEALYAGTPVIGSNLGGLAEVLKAAGQTTVTEGDVGEWNSTMTSALHDTRVTQLPTEFHWNSVARECLELYRQVTR